MITDRVKKPFSEHELRVLEMRPATHRSPELPIYDTAISPRENIQALFWDKKPAFVPARYDFSGINSDLYTDHLGRTRMVDGKPSDMTDVFGVDWVYVDAVGGSITKGGSPLFEDANDWKEFVKLPDIDAWDWQADADRNQKHDRRFAAEMTMINGFWFERLISQMDFMNAAIALADEDQTDAINEYLEAMTDLGCRVVDKICQYWPSVDGFMMHDDWGGQRDPFFSLDTARELFLPHMKKLVQHVHDKGRYCGLHSCGHLDARAEIFVEAGFDTWQMQEMNDAHRLYELYGDKIVVQAWPEPFDPNDEKAAVAAARNFVDTYCKPGKPVILHTYSPAINCRVFMEELYRYSRKHYLAQ